MTLAVIVFLGFGLEPAQADDTNGVSIQSIQVLPSTLKVGDSFTITITLVNNSTIPIWLDGGKCSVQDTQASFFTVIFDNHAKIRAKVIFCAGVGWSQILNPGKSITQTSPDYTAVYIATEPGTASATVTFSYHVINQTDPTQPVFSQKISQPLLFTILDDNTGSPVKPEKALSSPLKQVKLGVLAGAVKCEQGLQLVIKAEDGSPACVTPNTANILIERGWTKGTTSPISDSKLPTGTAMTVDKTLVKNLNLTATQGPHPKESDRWLTTHPNFFGCTHTDLRTNITKEVSCSHLGNPVYGLVK